MPIRMKVISENIKSSGKENKMQVEESKVFRLSWAEVNQTINEYL